MNFQTHAHHLIVVEDSGFLVETKGLSMGRDELMAEMSDAQNFEADMNWQWKV